MAKTFAQKLGFTEDEYKSICVAAEITWDSIGYDVLALNDGKSIRRSEVIDMVIDANRITSFNSDLDPKLKKILDAYDPAFYKIFRKALAADVFTFKTYGM
jgi:hypothetical protein